MNSLLRPVYSCGAVLAQAMAPAMAALERDSSGKIVRSFSARKGLISKWEKSASKLRDASRPLIWMHAPSVGEGLQARPVLRALRVSHPEYQQAYSWFSPSAESFGASVGADLSGYLPFDTPVDSDAILRILSPSVLAFAKLDIWPVLVEKANQRSIPTVLTSGTVAPRSGRRGLLARALLSDAYQSLSAVGAIDVENAERLALLGVRGHVISITGDVRFDQVWERARGVDYSSPLLHSLKSSRPTLVAGSTWPADEAALLSAWEQVHSHNKDARLVIAPHEPTQHHLKPIGEWAVRAGLRQRSLSDLELTGDPCEDTDVIVIDRVGVLGDVYGIADMAFVGGGFHAAGLHSVIEPAAFGIPVLFGPSHGMSREAGLLLHAGGAFSGDSAAIGAVILNWLESESSRIAAGKEALSVVERELGATARTADLILGAIRNC